MSVIAATSWWLFLSSHVAHMSSFFLCIPRSIARPAIVALGSSLSVVGSVATNTSSAGDGGFIYSGGQGSVHVGSTNISASAAAGFGGAFFFFFLTCVRALRVPCVGMSSLALNTKASQPPPLSLSRVVPSQELSIWRTGQSQNRSLKAAPPRYALVVVLADLLLP